MWWRMWLHLQKKRLLTRVDTIWPEVFDGEIVGMALHNAITSLELTVMSVTVVMKMCSLQNLEVFAQILSNRKTDILLHSYTVFAIRVRLILSSVQMYIMSFLYMVILWKSDTGHLCFFCFKHFILLKSRFESRTDMIVEPYVIHGEVSEANLSTFESHWSVVLPDLLHKKAIKTKVCSDWLNCWIGPTDWLVKI